MTAAKNLKMQYQLLVLGVAVYNRLAEDEFIYEPKSVYEAL